MVVEVKNAGFGACHLICALSRLTYSVCPVNLTHVTVHACWGHDLEGRVALIKRPVSIVL
jgi:hypothetical protein